MVFRRTHVRHNGKFTGHTNEKGGGRKHMMLERKLKQRQNAKHNKFKRPNLIMQLITNICCSSTPGTR